MILLGGITDSGEQMLYIVAASDSRRSGCFPVVSAYRTMPMANTDRMPKSRSWTAPATAAYCPRMTRSNEPLIPGKSITEMAPAPPSRIIQVSGSVPR